MEQGYIKSDFLTRALPPNSKELYDQYADKLLGYVLAVLTNRPLAEDIVVKVFTDVFSKNATISADNYPNTWSWLMALSQAELNGLHNATDECKTVTDDGTYIQSHKYLSKMNNVQRMVFCGVYYHRKSTMLLAQETGLHESVLRSALKEAFMIIRKVKDEN